MTKPLAKSLHTVTVLVRGARDIQSRQHTANDDAVTHALKLLGLADMPDAHGLALQAEKQLWK